MQIGQNRGRLFLSIPLIGGIVGAFLSCSDARIQTTQTETGALLQRGNEYAEAGDAAMAAELYGQEIARNPSNPHSYYLRGVLRQEHEQTNEAIKEFTVALQLEPRYVSALINRGTLFYRLGRYDEALCDYTRLVRLCPDDWRARNQRGNIYYRLRQYRESLRDYERAVDLGATDPFTYNNLAWLLITTGSANASRHAKRARKLAESALSMAIRSGMDGIELAHIYGTVAAAYAAEGDFDQAISNQVKALELYTKSDRTSIDAHSRLLIRYREGKVAPP